MVKTKKRKDNESKDLTKTFSPKTIYQYLGMDPGLDDIDDIDLSKLLDKTESSAHRLYRIAVAGRKKLKDRDRYLYPFFREGTFRIRGLPEVIENMAEKLYVGSLAYKNRQLPIILLVGPTGSGKTELGNIMEEGMIKDLYKNERYTYVFKNINGKKNVPCPFTEDPINLLTSSYLLIPQKIKEKFSPLSHSELCTFCRDTLEGILIDAKSGEKQGKNPEKESDNNKNAEKTNSIEDLTKNYLEILNEKISVVRLQPKIALNELTSKDFPKKFKASLENANRGIFNINVDDRDIDEIGDSNYQLLLSLADRKVPLGDGTYFTPDLVLFLYANENILERLNEKPTLRDRMLPIYVRRNLSYSEEEEIFKKTSLPFKHITPGGLSVIAKYSVATRIKDDGLDEEELRKRIEIFEKNELLKRLTEDEEKFVKERLPSYTASKDGWDSGLSSRAIARRLASVSYDIGECLTLEKIQQFLKKTNKEFSSNEENEEYFSSSENNSEGYNEVSYDLSENLISDIAFRDVTLSYIALSIDGNIKTVEEKFYYFYDLTKMSNIKNAKTIDIPGKGKVSIKEEKENTVKLLGIDPKNVEQLEGMISNYLDKTTDFKRPTYGDILTTYPDLIKGNESMKKYIPWDTIKQKFGPDDKKKAYKLIKIMKDLGYDEDCAISALYIAAERLK